MRVNSQARATVLFDWLVQNPIKNAADVTFVRGEVGKLATLAAAKERSARLQWSGSAPYVRLCHAVTDVEANKEAFLLSFQCLSREELDGRHNPDVARPDAWALIAETWNSREFNPRAAIYPGTHREFGQEMNISHAATVAIMGEMDAQKAKDKWQEMKTQSTLIVAESNVSGNGDGQRATGQRDYSLSTDDVSHITMDNDYSSFLKGRGPHNLYFLKHISKHDIVSQAMQQLNSDHVLDGTSIPSARGGKKRKSSSGSADNSEYLTAMNDTNK